jgi:transposase
MATRNKYIHRSKIFEAQFRQLVRLFSVDLNATQIVQVAG